MPFPITVDPDVSSSEQPGTYFFNVGTARYQVLIHKELDVDGVDIGDYLTVFKSTAATRDDWTEQDSGNRIPVYGPGVLVSLPFTPYTAKLVGTKIYAFYDDLATVQVAVQAFDTATDTWGAQLALAPLTPNGLPWGTASNQLVLPQMCGEYRALDNSILISVPGATVNIDGVIDHALPCVIPYDVTGNSFGLWVTAGYQDYTNPVGFYTDWDMVPCKITIKSNGVARLYSQQVAREGTTQQLTYTYSADDTFTVPNDCTLLDTVILRAAGGGGGGFIGSPGYGGGGGGIRIGTNIVVTPGGAMPVVIGVKGVGDSATGVGTAGTDTTFAGLTASGGSGGTTLAPGVGGGGTFSGGTGGTPSAAGGGGGEGADTAGNGVDGGNGALNVGGTGGFGGDGGDGGKGGDNNGLRPDLVNGDPGIAPGGAGGGCATIPAAPPPNIGGDGADGQLDIFYTPGRIGQPGRVFQQQINTDNTMGTLAEMTECRFPVMLFPIQPNTIPFSAISTVNGKQVVVLTGTVADGRGNVTVGIGDDADPVVFSFASFTAGNSGSEISPNPEVVEDASGNLYCVYISCSGITGAAAFLYRTASTTNGTFGAAATLGTISATTVEQYSRIQLLFAGNALDMTFGTPSRGSVTFSSPG